VGDTSTDIGPVTAFDLLSARRRLAAVVAVEEADEPVSSEELARMTAAAEGGRPPGLLGGRTSRSVRAALEREHLPALVAHDVLRDADGGYEAGTNMEQLLAIVDAGVTRSEAPDALADDERRPGEPGGPPFEGRDERSVTDGTDEWLERGDGRDTDI
jgi:hypothetical protein